MVIDSGKQWPSFPDFPPDYAGHFRRDKQTPRKHRDYKAFKVARGVITPWLINI